MALVFNRKQQKIEGCHFTMKKQTATSYHFEALHKIPLPLKIIMPKLKKTSVVEVISFDENSISVVSRSISEKPLFVESKTTYKTSEAGIVVDGTVSMKIFDKPLPKFLRQTFKKFSEKKAMELRAMEQEVARNLS